MDRGLFFNRDYRIMFKRLIHFNERNGRCVLRFVNYWGFGTTTNIVSLNLIKTVLRFYFWKIKDFLRESYGFYFLETDQRVSKVNQRTAIYGNFVDFLLHHFYHNQNVTKLNHFSFRHANGNRQWLVYIELKICSLFGQ